MTTGLPWRIANKLIRIIEGPPVRERTVVKVVRAEDIPRLPAGFIVGTYRSGSTLLRYVLDSHSRIAVPPESNFLVTLAELFTSEWNRKGFKGVAVDDAQLAERLRGFAGDIFDAYAVAKSKTRWFDKTPAYVEILNFLDWVFGAQTTYIMLYRHGLDVATSLAGAAHVGTVFAGADRRYATEYEHSPRIAYVRYWVDCAEKMLSFEAKHPKQCFRIRYEDYVRDPAGYLRPLFAFINEPWETAVLDFSSKSHDFGLQDSKILETKGFNPSVNNYRSWSKEDVARAAEIAEPTLSKLGYQI